MLNHLIALSLRHQTLVLLTAAIVLATGSLWTLDMPIDVFPDLTAPTVTVITETQGLGPEEVELLVTFPLESALNGAPGVRRVRSVSADGISVIWVEFDWAEDVYRARQVVTERIQPVSLPERIEPPQLGPISSIMGEITFVALTSDSASVTPMELRRLAETVIRRSLLAIPGISQATPLGGEVREFQVELDPARMIQHGAQVEEIAEALSKASQSPAAGFHVDQGEEYLVRGMGRARNSTDLALSPVRVHEGVPLRVGDLATVQDGPEPKRGTASYNARPAVILSVQKQPSANTLDLTRDIDRVLHDLESSLPPGVQIEKENFRQADFIRVAIHNVIVAMRDGAVLVIAILLLFLGNVRTTLISAISLPLSLVTGILMISWFGLSINTMTLGGLTIAIGALVDDAIIDVENVFRRLRENRTLPPDARRPSLEVVFSASSEVRKAIFFATLIIGVVFVPLFFLPGMEGRLLRPLGLAYILALAASLLVSLTVTPVLCLYLLPNSKGLGKEEPALMRLLKRAYRSSLELALRNRAWVIGGAAVAFLATLSLVPWFGRGFLPPFNEGSLTVAMVSVPGIPLSESDAIGRQVEEALLAFPEVVSTSRRTGRAEKDEHVQGVNASEMEVVLRPGRPKPELLTAMRKAVSTIPGVNVSFGQPISHRIDHMISGSKSNLAVKIFGPELSVLRSIASRCEQVLRDVPGIVDLSNTEQSGVPQLLIEFDRAAMARHALSAQTLSRTVEAMFQGTEVGEIVENGVASRIVVRLPARLREERDALSDLPVVTPAGETIRLADVARIRFDLGPGLVRRESVQRVAMLTANIAGTDLAGTVEEARRRIHEAVNLPTGYRIVFGGQFEEALKSVQHLVVLGVLILVAVYALLYRAFGNHRHTLIVLVNLPLALIGGLLAVALGPQTLNIATLVGFITLFGVATRNGVLLVSHYQNLMRDEGVSLADAVRTGSLQRLGPILMTALCAGLALIPLVLAGQEPGNEIQSPMGQVILGGLLTSTFLNMILVPVLFVLWGGSASRKAEGESVA